MRKHSVLPIRFYAYSIFDVNINRSHDTANI